MKITTISLKDVPSNKRLFTYEVEMAAIGLFVRNFVDDEIDHVAEWWAALGWKARMGYRAKAYEILSKLGYVNAEGHVVEELKSLHTEKWQFKALAFNPVSLEDAEDE